MVRTLGFELTLDHGEQGSPLYMAFCLLYETDYNAGHHNQKNWQQYKKHNDAQTSSL